jgi:hypothetical protein
MITVFKQGGIEMKMKKNGEEDKWMTERKPFLFNLLMTDLTDNSLPLPLLLL